MDVTPLVFLPFFAVVLTLGVGIPLAAARALWFRRVGASRMAHACCGRCAFPLATHEEHYVTLGVRVCRPCANAVRRRVGLALVGAAVTVTGLALLSTGALVTVLAGATRPEWSWWTRNARLVPLLIPTVAVLATTMTAIGLGKFANRIAAARLRAANGAPLVARALSMFDLPAHGTPDADSMPWVATTRT